MRYWCDDPRCSKHGEMGDGKNGTCTGKAVSVRQSARMFIRRKLGRQIHDLYEIRKYRSGDNKEHISVQIEILKKLRKSV